MSASIFAINLLSSSYISAAITIVVLPLWVIWLFTRILEPGLALRIKLIVRLTVTTTAPTDAPVTPVTESARAIITPPWSTSLWFVCFLGSVSKLTVTFPKTVGQIPFNFPCKPSSQIDGGKNPGMEGNMSRANGALYPFGYGLSYTTFEYSDLKISPAIITPNQQTFVTCKVTNTGKRAGDEVVQLYVRDVLSSVTTYEKNLAGFERVHLQPGETKEVTFPIDRKALELLNADMHWVVEPGDFTLMVGASSTDIRLNGTLTVVEPGRIPTTEADKDSSPVSASTNAETANNVIDNNLTTSWEGNKGDYITFALQNGAKVDGVSIAFSRENGLDTNFEIQLSSGGGQFLTVYSGIVKEYNKLLDFHFKGTTASDLRIVLGDDRIGITEVKLPQLKK